MKLFEDESKQEFFDEFYSYVYVIEDLAKEVKRLSEIENKRQENKEAIIDCFWFILYAGVIGFAIYGLFEYLAKII